MKIWDLATLQETLTLRGHESSVSCVAISQDGTRIATGDQTRIKLWDIAHSYRTWGPSQQ